MDEPREILKMLFFGRQMPAILQAEAAECGLVCLLMVSSHFGGHYSLASLRRRFSTSLKGATLAAIMEMGDTLGMTARPLRLELDELKDLKLPAILHWNLSHYVVLKEVRGSLVVIHDPAVGRRTLTLDEVSAHFTGVALELTPTPAFQPTREPEKVRISDLFHRSRGINPAIAQLFLLALVLQAFSMLSPILNQLVVDDVIGKGDLDLLTTIAVGMGLMALISTAASTLRGFIGLYLGTQLAYQMQSNLLRHVLRLPISWFEKRHIGDIQSRFGSLGPVQTVVTSSLVSILLNSLLVGGALIMMIVYSPRLAIIETGAVLLFFGIRAASFPWLRQKSVEGISLNARLQSTFLETIRGARTFKLFGRERQRLATWQNEQVAAINNSVQVARVSLWGGAGSQVLSTLEQLVVWYLGARMVVGNEISLGMLFAFQAYTSQMTSAAECLVSQYFTLKTAKIHLERLADIVHADPESDGGRLGQNTALKGDIEIQNVSFRYAEHEPWILKNVNLRIKSSDLTCFVGPSGQGKTTLMKLILGFYEPQEGRILVDGFDIKNIGLSNLRANVGVVMQDDLLFSGTVSDNIAFFDPDMDMGKVEAAARTAGIENEILSMPMGYLSLISDMGSGLSGGQRQRILLARALYREPAMLFLDEGTANLDTENESRIMDALAAMNITRLVIAHRPAAMVGADHILRVEGGAVFPEEGPTEELLAIA